jgi:hypothetical protein
MSLPQLNVDGRTITSVQGLLERVTVKHALSGDSVVHPQFLTLGKGIRNGSEGRSAEDGITEQGGRSGCRSSSRG